MSNQATLRSKLAELRLVDAALSKEAIPATFPEYFLGMDELPKFMGAWDAIAAVNKRTNAFGAVSKDREVIVAAHEIRSMAVDLAWSINQRSKNVIEIQRETALLLKEDIYEAVRKMKTALKQSGLDAKPDWKDSLLRDIDNILQELPR